MRARHDLHTVGPQPVKLLDSVLARPLHAPDPLDWPAKTIKAGVHGVPGGEHVVLLDDGSHRYLTVRECARMQTFPDSWTFAGPRSEAW